MKKTMKELEDIFNANYPYEDTAPFLHLFVEGYKLKEREEINDSADLIKLTDDYVEKHLGGYKNDESRMVLVDLMLHVVKEIYQENQSLKTYIDQMHYEGTLNQPDGIFRYRQKNDLNKTLKGN